MANAEQQEEARKKAAEHAAKDARQKELHRREAMRQAHAKATWPPLVSGS